ncbi:DNA phosphorothioation-associated putative methyltransferase [Paraburkholderia pallida]|uniref:DNA phosphorothioation-associated putative methyltransferase n=1 Tax=Paraburkholderia pallida TaxID=2547399 RepID=A0A4P7CJQ1_9BURK|nr:DNA phosphorothioation-associated putative methyltransferase [Paraburkholderia pallida]QBQ95915.1 DNA phosphorothioation-associated putative methyltransferase [Paraburkholderia pallida]
MNRRADTVGKRVGSSLYVHRDAALDIDSPSIELFREALAVIAQAEPKWNVVRLSLTDREVAFLDYPLFESEPFPCLASSCLVKLDPEPQFNVRDFRSSLNPPILHRKELLLHPDDTRRCHWSRITADAEAIGLFEESWRIGLRQDWLQRIAEAGYNLIGDTFVPSGNLIDEGTAAPADSPQSATVERYRTALTRLGLSAPMQALIRFGLLTKDKSLFDYGCGKGDDVEGLNSEGYNASGWDPHFAPTAPQVPGDLVSLGFVLNVIEDREERDRTLSDAFGLARIALSVAVMTESASSNRGQPYRDGYLTSRRTFQRYFSQAELKSYIESVLQRPAVLVAPGIAFVFTSDQLEEQFRLDRQRSSRVYLRVAQNRRTTPRVPQPRIQASTALYSANQSEFNRLWTKMLQLGRGPAPEEAEEFADLINACGSLSKAVRLCEANNDLAELVLARQERIDDLRVYFALQAFRDRVALKMLNVSLKQDVRYFFGSLSSAQAAGAELLRTIASPSVIAEACEQAAQNGFGYYPDNHSLQVHTSLVEALPTVLRAYIGAAATIYGDVRSADLVKVHVRSGKLTLLEFDDFDSSPTPLLRRRVKIHLRTQQIDVFESGENYEPTLLLGKSKFINEEFPGYSQQVALDEQLLSLCRSLPAHGPTKSQFEQLLRDERMELSGFELRPSQAIPSLDDACGRWYTYRDLTQCSETAQSTGIENTPLVPQSYNALFALVKNIIDPVIDYFGRIELTHGFCSPQLARAIKRQGVGRIATNLDQHAAHEINGSGNLICSRGGAAVDFLIHDENMYEVAEWITANLPFDRIYIYGTDRPIHVSFSLEPAKQVVFVDRSGGKVRPRIVQDFSALPR